MTFAVVAIVATAFAARFWASVEMARLAAKDPKLAKMMRRASCMSF